MGDYQGANGHDHSELLELLSALYSGEMRPVRRPAEDTDIGHMLPYRRISFGLDAIEVSEHDILDGAAFAAAELPEREEGAAPSGAFTCC